MSWFKSSSLSQDQGRFTQQRVILLQHCTNFANERSLLRKNLSRLTIDKLPSCDISAIELLLYGDDSLDLITKTLILNASVNFILSSKRFEDALF